jgi:hypothetical protein
MAPNTRATASSAPQVTPTEDSVIHTTELEPTIEEAVERVERVESVTLSRSAGDQNAKSGPSYEE